MSGDSHAQVKLAVLIDGDNAPPSIAEGLVQEIAKFGIASVKRIYGDWTTPNLVGWKKVLLEHSIQPIQQFRHTVGKNATDSALIIDAMDLLHGGRFDGFCLISSDSDFTRLASRIREEGLFVIGFGERKTPQSFVSACDKFVFNDVLGGAEGTSKGIPKKSEKELRTNRKLVALFHSAIEAFSDEEGWAHLGAVGSNMVKQSPEFDHRNYGYKKLSELIEAIGIFEVKRKEKGFYLRDKRRAKV